MKPPPPLVLVLWCHFSDELVATTYIVKLREQGIQVKLLGLEGRRLRGAHGLTLLPDFTLDQAWQRVTMVRAIILPFETARLLHYLNDPRLFNLLQQTLDHGATLLLKRNTACEVLAQLAERLERDVGSLQKACEENDQLSSLIFQIQKENLL